MGGSIVTIRPRRSSASDKSDGRFGMYARYERHWTKTQVSHVPKPLHDQFFQRQEGRRLGMPG